MITRRSFLGSLSAASSLAALQTLSSPRSALSAALSTQQANRRASHAQFHSLPPGAVKPDGWLGLYLDKQAKGLSLHLPEVSRPFNGAFWAGEEKAPSWWPWEQRGYWIDGALRCALVTGDQQLLQ